LAGQAANKFLIKNLFQQFIVNENFYTFFIEKYTSLLYDVFNWASPEQSTISCLQLFEFLL